MTALVERIRARALRLSGLGYLAGNVMLLAAGAANTDPLQLLSAALFIFSGLALTRGRFSAGCALACGGMACLVATLGESPARWVTSALFLGGMGLGALEGALRPRLPARAQALYRPAVATGAGLSRLPMIASAVTSAQPLIAVVASCWLFADLCIAASKPAAD